MENPMFEEVCERIDGHVFSGDALLSPENRREFREYLERWERELDNMDRLAEEQEECTDD